MKRPIPVLFAMVALLLWQVATLAQATSESTPGPATIGELRIIGSQTLPIELMVDDTQVGGLSGIDYDTGTGSWIAVSDDRSELYPARFFTLRLDYSMDTFESVTVDSAVTLLQSNGRPYPNSSAGGEIPDFETIRFDPFSSLVWYGSEGTATRSLPPFLALSTRDGAFVAAPSLPAMFDVDPNKVTGPRDNYGLEGLTFSQDGTTIWMSLETPLYQDGPVPTTDRGAPVRITNIDRSGNMLAQVVYELDAIPVETYEGFFFDTGLTEILVVDEHRFLAIERSTVEDAAGLFENYIRIYEFDVSGATNVAPNDWLVPGSYTPVSKRLVLDLNAAGADPIDNIEGISWGPVLDNGNRSLVLTSDNNFNETQVTVFFAIEVMN